MTKYFYRTVIKSKPTKDGFFEMWYVQQYLKTEDISPFNRYKKVRFVELEAMPEILRDARDNEIVTVWLKRKKSD